MKKINPGQLQLEIQFSERLNDVDLWVSKAKELLFASNCLKSELNSQWSKIKIKDGKLISNLRDPLVQGSYFMLIAYAVENLFKATIIHRKKEELRNRLISKIPQDVFGHDLLKLANDIGMNLNLREQNILARLTQNSVWSARYPIPLEANKMTTTVKLLKGQVAFSAYFAPSDISEIEKFICRLRKEMKEELDLEI